MTTDLESLERRIACLECRNRRLMRGGALLVLVLAALGLMGQALPRTRTVEAEQFIVRDKAGRGRAVLGMEYFPGAEGIGDVTLTLANEAGLEQVRLSASSLLGQSMLVLNESGQQKASLSLRVAEERFFGSSVEFRDANKKLRAWFKVNKDGPALTMSDDKGGTRLGAGVSKEGPVFLLQDENQIVRASLSAIAPDGAARLQFDDKDGKEIPLPSTTASVPAHAWVLWRQGMIFVGGRMEQVILAVDAWPTRQQCEAGRAREWVAEEQRGKPTDAISLLVCLPDTVNLRQQR